MNSKYTIIRTGDRLKTQDDRREWQAQYFAGCLLMPEYKLLECKRGRDLTNWKHLYAIADELCVTISNLIYRLQKVAVILINKTKKRQKGETSTVA